MSSGLPSRDLDIADSLGIFLIMTAALAENTSPPEELEIAVEKALGRPFSGNLAERIQALEKRIAYLNDQRRRSEHTGEPLRTALLRCTDADLTEAKQQLKEWQTQQEGRNRSHGSQGDCPTGLAFCFPTSSKVNRLKVFLLLSGTRAAVGKDRCQSIRGARKRCAPRLARIRVQFLYAL